MNDPANIGLPILALLLGCWLFLWLYVLLPVSMARVRNRSAFIWVLIALFGSPILAILLLLALGKSPAHDQGR